MIFHDTTARLGGKREERSRLRPRVFLELLEGRTVPSFLPAVDYPAGDVPAFVALGDFNADGIPDFVTANYHPDVSTLGVRMGAGDGTFGAPLPPLPVGREARVVHAADLNGDGCADLVNTNTASRTLSVHLSNCDGTFGPRQDFNTENSAVGVTAADFDRDGTPDLAIANSDGPVRILFGLGGGSFGAARGYGLEVGGGLILPDDVDGDGRPDLIFTDEYNGYHVIPSGPDGTFEYGVCYEVGIGTFGIAPADLDGDGILDLAIANRLSSSISLAIGNGDGTYRAARDLLLGADAAPVVLVTADFDLDGDIDLAVTTAGNNQVCLLLNDGRGFFPVAWNLPIGASPMGLAAGDFNGDGLPDLIATNAYSASVSVLLNDGVWLPGPRGDDGGREASRLLPRSQDRATQAAPAAVRPPAVLAAPADEVELTTVAAAEAATVSQPTRTSRPGPDWAATLWMDLCLPE